MPSSVAHAAVAVIANPLLARDDRSPALMWLAAGAAAAPDLDAISWLLHGGQGFLPMAHRGITHSIPTAIMASTVLATLWHTGRIRPTRRSERSGPLRSPERAFIYLALVIGSHGLLDSLTIYGDPVAFLAPFSELRYKPFGTFFRGPISEVLCLWLPALVFIGFNVGRFRKPISMTTGPGSSPGEPAGSDAPSGSA